MRPEQVPTICGPADLDALARRLEPLPARAILLANNARIAPQILERLPLDEATLLVQFNDPLFDAALRPRPGRRLYAATHHQGSFFGFPDGLPRQPLLARDGPRPLFLFCGRDLSQLAPFLERRPPGVACLQVADKRHFLPDYPRGRAASTGFLASVLLLALNRRLVAAGRRPLELRLVGFTGYRRGALPLHDWWYERRWLHRQPELLLDEAGAAESGWRWRAAGWCLSHWRSRLRGTVARLRGKT